MIDNYNNLPLGKYHQILQVSKDEHLEELDKQVSILSILSDMPEDEILHLPIGEYRQMANASAFLADIDKNKHLVSKRYYFGGMELIPTTDYRKIETAQYVDFQTFAADVDANLVELVSVFLIPKGCRYNEGYDILDVQKAIREEMSVTDALSVTAFFLTSLNRSMVDSLNLCMKMAKGIPDRKQRKTMVAKVKEAQTLL